MENGILDSLEDIGYKDLDSTTLEEALKLGSSSSSYTSLVSHLIRHLCSFYDIEESVNGITESTPEASSYFLLELNGFLREYGCPYKQLVEGSLEQRLQDRQSCLLLLDYLITEYQAAQIYFTDKPQEVLSHKPTPVNKEVSCSTLLKQMLICLSFPKPPSTITPFQLFSKVEAKITELTAKYPNAIGSPLLKARLTSTQWDKVLDYNTRLTQEYNLRREMLRKRLEVTIQSFLWSDKAKTKQDEAIKAYQPLRAKLKDNPVVSISDLLSARDSLLNIEKTNLNRKRTETHINKVIMGDVPDRGGRTATMQAPPPEMPSFMKRQADSAPKDQRSFSGRGGGRGGRVQGSWAGGGGDRSAGGRGGGGGKGGGKRPGSGHQQQY